MLDYSYLKKKVEDEQKGKDEAFKEQIKKYYDNEEKIVDLFIRKIKENIEDAVYHFYRDGQDNRVIKKGIFNKKYHYSQIIRAWINGYLLIDNLDSKNPCPSFPNKMCLESFIKKMNEILNRDNITIKIGTNSYDFKECFYVYVWAELGELS